MEFRNLVFTIAVGITIVLAKGNLEPEGCENGWHHFQDFCYLPVNAHIHFDSAKAICLLKGGTLTSLLGKDEIAFVKNILQNLHVNSPYTWIGTGIIRNKWMWLDGSGSLEASFEGLPQCSHISESLHQVHIIVHPYCSKEIRNVDGNEVTGDVSNFYRNVLLVYNGRNHVSTVSASFTTPRGLKFGEFLREGTSLPEVSKEMCGYLTADGSLKFMDCDLTLPVFVCKKPLDIIFVPSSMNISESGITLSINDPNEIIFERLWPPYLHRVILNLTSSNYIATVEVAQATDCAFRCYNLDECRAFAVKCKSARKCSIRYCILLAGLDVR